MKKLKELLTQQESKPLELKVNIPVKVPGLNTKHPLTIKLWTLDHNTLLFISFTGDVFIKSDYIPFKRNQIESLIKLVFTKDKRYQYHEWNMHFQRADLWRLTRDFLYDENWVKKQFKLFVKKMETL